MRRFASVNRSVAGSVVAAGLGLAGLGVGLGLGGCQSTQLDEIRADVSPMETTEIDRWDDMKNQMTVTNDTNVRLFWSDMGRLLLLDRPSRLTPAPMR
jgi:hypothetical protein